MELFQYQVLAEPLPVPVVVTVDLSWLPVTPTLFPRPRMPVAVTGGGFTMGAVPGVLPFGPELFILVQSVPARPKIKLPPEVKGYFGPPLIVAVTVPDHIVVPYTVDHDEHADHARSRRHEQQVSAILNNLLRQGELIGGSPLNAALGYVAGNIQHWAGAKPPVTLRDAIDRLAAALDSLGQKP